MKKHVLIKVTGLLCLLLICICAAGCTDQSPSTELADTKDTVQTPPTKVAAAGDTVQVNYKGYFDDGEVFDSSDIHGKPLTFVVGGGQVVPGFNAAVEGMAIGEKKSVRLSPDQAYGEWTEKNFMMIDKNDFPENSTFEINQSVYLSTPQGAFTFPIIAIDESTVTIDTNHHLAGKTLNFDIELVSISPADA